MLRTLTSRLYPTPSQEERLRHYLEVGRTLYNAALEQRREFYEDEGKGLTFYSQTIDLTELRAVSPILQTTPVQIERDALRRLDLAFRHFFRRVKEGNGRKPGYPRFKAAQRWNSFAMLEPGKVVYGSRIRVSGVDGKIKTRNLRVPEGEYAIKQQRIVLRAGKWYCQIVVDDGRLPPPLLPVHSAVGIDLGLKSFAVASDGQVVENPRFARPATRKLARAHRVVSRRKKGSRNRRKAVNRLQRVYARVADLRSNFTHHLSKEFAGKHQLIAVENLNVGGMVQGWLGKSILDAAWSQFTFRVAFKAESAGGRVVFVNPSGTSQDCSQCGQTVPKLLAVRVHRCPHCGLVLDRDLNAARNVLQRALRFVASAPGRGGGNACGGEKARPRSRKV